MRHSFKGTYYRNNGLNNSCYLQQAFFSTYPIVGSYLSTNHELAYCMNDLACKVNGLSFQCSSHVTKENSPVGRLLQNGIMMAIRCRGLHHSGTQRPPGSLIRVPVSSSSANDVVAVEFANILFSMSLNPTVITNTQLH